MTNGLSHLYQLDLSTFIFRGIKSAIFIFISFFDEIPVNKQNSPRWDAAFCGVTAGLFYLPMPHKKDARLIWVNEHCSHMQIMFRLQAHM